MNSIPNKALKIGAESLNKDPVEYGKVRVSGSKEATYILHSKAICMPGKTSIFTVTYLSFPKLNDPLEDNQVINAFKINKVKNSSRTIGLKFSQSFRSLFTYQRYAPHDDESLAIAINAVYRQIFGNFKPMESERPIEEERRLRNGDITIKEFIRRICKSPFYMKNYFQDISQQRSIELNIKHILGRPPLSQKEIINNINLIHEKGFYIHIDSLIDSSEYEEIYGEDTVPFMRCWSSSNGITTSSFLNSAILTKGFSCSDNAIHASFTKELKSIGKSQLISQLAIKKSLN